METLISIKRRKCDPKKTTWNHLKVVHMAEGPKTFFLVISLFPVVYVFLCCNLQNNKGLVMFGI